jgi:hypothetical protein
MPFSRMFFSIVYTTSMLNYDNVNYGIATVVSIVSQYYTKKKILFFQQFPVFDDFYDQNIILPQNSNFPIEVQKPIFDMLFVCVFSYEKAMFHFCCN